jgi:cation diffusion facilitator family transporter
MSRHTSSDRIIIDRAGHHVAERPARFYTLFSIAAAVITIVLKLTAYFLTNSVGLFSDAAESLVNLIAALAAFGALTLAARPADLQHTYGYSKAEYLSSGLEGAMILVAGGAIAMAAVERLIHPEPIGNLGLGLAVSVLAAAVNGGVALVLLRAGRRLRSITLRADGQHLLTDVWTTGGVVVGVLLVQLTGWVALDPIIGLLVTLSIGWTAFRLIRETTHGLLDTALPEADQQVMATVLARYQAQGVRFHALRNRMSGQRRFMSMHVLVPGTWTVQRGHTLCEQIERDLIRELPQTTVFTHLEPVEDPLSLIDQELDRRAVAEADEAPSC